MRSFTILAVTLSVFACVYCDHEKVLMVLKDKRTAFTDDESILIDLKHTDPMKDGKEDDTIIKVRLHFSMNENNEVHCNGYHMRHGQVTRLHLNMMLEVEREGQLVKEPREAPVVVRVLVSTRNLPNGDEVIFAEQEIIAVDRNQVIQLTVHHVYWKKATRQRVIERKAFGNTKLSERDFNNDQHMYGEGVPHLPDEHGYGFDPRHHPHHHHHCHHHHRHHHHGHHGSFKCWYRHLSLRSKIAFFGGAAVTLLMLVFAVACCVRARQTRARTLTVDAPMDDVTVVADEKKDAKQLEDDKYKFHFEMDNAVVVDDKKELIS